MTTSSSSSSSSSSSRRVRVLVVDDSAAMRALVRALLSRAPDIEIVGEAEDGARALVETARLRPDVVTMDVLMPGLDGIRCVELLMVQTPTRILVVSSAVDVGGAALSLRAISAGALEVLGKPGPRSDPGQFGAALIEAVRLMAEVPVIRRHHTPHTAAPVDPGRVVDVVGVAASTGGPPVLAALLGCLRGVSGPPVLLAQHLAAGFAPGLARWLQETTGVCTVVAVDGVIAARGTVYVAPDDSDLVLEPGGRLRTPLPAGPHRPSADRLLGSVAAVCGARCAGVVLTGMGDDGAAGLLAVRDAGGVTLVQDPRSSLVSGMPAAALANGAAIDGASIDSIAAALSSFARRGGFDVVAAPSAAADRLATVAPPAPKRVLNPHR